MGKHQVLLCSQKIMLCSFCHLKAIFVISWSSWSRSAQAVSIMAQLITLFNLSPKHSGTVSPDLYCKIFTTNR